MTLSHRLPVALRLAALVAPIALAACRPDTTLDEVNDTCDLEDEWAGNSSRTAAASIDGDLVDNAWTGDAFLCQGDEDWFSFTAYPGQVLEADLLFSQASGDLQLELVNQVGATLLQVNTLTDNESLRHTFVDGGTYYLRVSGSGSGEQNAYSLSLNLVGDACDPDTLEPNNASFDAAELPPGDYTDLTVCFGETDWYDIPAADGQLVSATALVNASETDLRLYLYREKADGTLAWLGASQSTADGEQIVQRVYGEGPFRLNVARGPDTVNATYDLNLEITGEACVADVNEPNNGYFETTNVPSSGASFTGQTLCVGDRDWFEFEVGDSQLVTAKATFEHASSDIGMQLYQLNEDGTATYRSGADTLTDNETITYRPFSGGSYALHVYPSRGTTIGAYDLDITFTGDECLDDAWEPNDGYYQAAALDPGAYAEMTLCVGDDDWYSTQLLNGQLLNVELEFTHAENDLGLNVYKLNDDGTVSSRAGSNTLTDNENVLYRPFDSGEFLVRVYRTRGAQLATYGLNVAIDGEECVNDATEPNDAYTEAQPITVNAPQTGLTLCVGDADWFSFEAANGQLVDIDLDFEHAKNDLGMTLYKLNDDGTISGRVGANTVTDGEFITYQPYDSGTFLLYIYRTRGTQVANYDVEVDVTGSPCVADAYEPNNAQTEASPITDTSESGLTLCVGDADWYSFTAQNGQLIEADLAFEHAKNDLGMNVYRLMSDGTLQSRAGANTLTDNETIKYQPYDSGEFLLYVYRTRGTQVATYDLDFALTGQPCSGDGFEPNDTYASAQALPQGSHADLTLCVGDADWYQIPDMSAGNLIDATLSFSHEDSDLGMRVYRIASDGTLQSRSTADTLTDNEFLVYRPYDSGEFLLYVYRSRGTTVASYDLEYSLTTDGCEPDAFEPNEHWLQAADLTGGLNTDHVGLNSCVADDDYYFLGDTFAQGDVINVTVTFTHGPQKDLGLALYGINDNNAITTLTSVDSTDDNETRTYTVSSTWANKPIVARVYRSRGTAFIDYDLRVDVP